MDQHTQLTDRRTSADVVFDYLYEEIVSLRLLPGAKISEAEIASRFNVSRQPVRDAFSRLGNMELLQIRPQRATEVKRFSDQVIHTARFVRAAVELEVVHMAVEAWDSSKQGMLEDHLAAQEDAVTKQDGDAFHQLDYEFHKLLCHVAEADYAFDVIAEKKAIVDRLCVLSLSRTDRMYVLLEDHRKIVENISAGKATEAMDIARLHLSRLDGTIKSIRETHSDYFEH